MVVPHKDDWFQFCRPYLEELNPRDDLDLPVYVAGIVERALAFNADTVVFMADEGGYPNYPSRLTPTSDHLHGQDLLGLVAEKAHEAGLRFGAGFLGMHCNNYVRDAHPEWLQRDKDGQPAPFYTGFLVCPTSPYRRYYAYEYVREVVSRNPVDYIYAEGVYIRPGFCYCDHCRAQFKAMYGRDLAEEPLNSVAFRRFRQDSVTRFHELIRRAVDEASPQTVVVGCGYPAWMRTTDVTTFRDHMDMVARENQWGHSPGILPQEAGLRILLLKAEAKKPVLGTWFAAHQVDQNYAPRSPAHARLTFMETLAHGATVQPHIQTLFEVDQTLMPVLAELFECVKRVRPYLMSSRLLPYAAILDWAGSEDVEHYFGDALKGVYRALIEHHVPLDVVTVEDVMDGRLSDYRVLILPEALKLSDAVVNQIIEYVEGGGGLVFTCRSGWEDDQEGTRGPNALLKLAGARFGGMAGSIDPKALPIYYRVVETAEPWTDLAGRLMAFQGEYVEVSPVADAHVVARIEDMDYSRMHKDHMTEGAYPGAPIGPMVLSRKAGAGRVVYIAGSLATSARQIGDREALDVLARATLWAAGHEPPVITDCPPSVEVVTHSGPGGMAMFLINETTNQIDRLSIIRYVVPVHDVKIRLKVPSQPAAVATLKGNEADWSYEDGWLSVRLDRVEEYEVVLIDL